MRILPLIRRFCPVPSFLRRSPVDPMQPKRYTAVMAGGFSVGGSADTRLDEFIAGASERPQLLHFPLPTPRLVKSHAKIAVGGNFRTQLITPARAAIAIRGEFRTAFRYAHHAVMKIGIGGKAITRDDKAYRQLLAQIEEEDELLILGLL
jgi:hypothetical protein